MTFPFSTNTGTVRGAPGRDLKRRRASGSSSTSYSAKSLLRNSSHSRISRVCGQRDEPKSSRLGILAHSLQRFTHGVIDRRLHFLNSRDVVGLDNNRKVGKILPFNFSSVVSK